MQTAPVRSWQSAHPNGNLAGAFRSGLSMAIPPSSRLAGVKDYISQRENKRSLMSTRWAAPPGEDGHAQARNTIQSWSRWAGQKIRRSPTDVATVDEVHLFPGWATKRPHTPAPNGPEGTFDVVLHVSGFATSRRAPEFLTRSQRAFLKLARGFASIPKPQSTSHPTDIELQDCPDWLRLPPRPYEISDDYDVETLEAHFRNSGNHDHDIDDFPCTPQLATADTLPAELARLHENLESRLKLFWASSLSSRRVQVSVFLRPPDSGRYQEPRPLLIREMLTGPDGYFSGTFRVDWRDIHTSSIGRLAASSQTEVVDHELLVKAQVISTEPMSDLHEISTNSTYIPITNSILRVISDVDDTVKLSRVVEGARAIFHQVFVKDLEDTIIPGMGEWYDMMWKSGVRFHYVSNSPFELLPVMNQFFSISKLPLGSIRLRSYAGRSLFNGLLSAPAARKKGSVVEVLDQFPVCQFFLVGDSGEQDLELYSSLAAERPGQIAGVFIRDVSAVGLEDPTGAKADFGLNYVPMKSRAKGTVPLPGGVPTCIQPKRAASDTDVSTQHPGAIYIPRPIKKGSLPFTSDSFEPSPDLKPPSRVSEDSSSSIASSSSSLSSNVRPVRPITEGERKRWDLQNRVNKARILMPPHIVLRVFEDPRDCVEAKQIVQRLLGVS